MCGVGVGSTGSTTGSITLPNPATIQLEPALQPLQQVDYYQEAMNELSQIIDRDQQRHQQNGIPLDYFSLLIHNSAEAILLQANTVEAALKQEQRQARQLEHDQAIRAMHA